MELRLKWVHKGPNGSAQFELKSEDDMINFGVIFYTKKSWYFACPLYDVRWDMETEDIWEAQTEAVVVLHEHLMGLYKKLNQAVTYLDFDPVEYRKARAEKLKLSHDRVAWKDSVRRAVANLQLQNQAGSGSPG